MPLCRFLNGLLDQIWAVQPQKLADAAPYEIVNSFTSDQM